MSFLRKRSKSVFRSTPNTDLRTDNLKQLVLAHDLFDHRFNPEGRGFQNDFSVNDRVVMDNASGLMWPIAVSPGFIHAEALNYVKELNKRKFGGYKKWRLPTVEEALSLINPKKAGDSYTDLRFEQKSRVIWTCDGFTDSAAHEFVWAVLLSSDDLTVHYYNKQKATSKFGVLPVGQTK